MTRRRHLRVLCLSVYPRSGPSLRHRVLNYRPYWEAAGVQLTVQAFLTEGLFARRRRFGGLATAYKVGMFLFCILRMLVRLPFVGRYDVLIVHREVFPLGGAHFERLAGWINPRIVLDVDDAIWAPMPLAVNQRGRFWDPERVADTLRASRVAVMGNDFLAAYARRYCEDVVVVPTPYRDLGGGGAARGGDAGRPPIIVWIGNVGNEEYLRMLAAPLSRLAERHDFVLRIIGSPDIHSVRMEGVNVERLVWSEAMEGRWLLEAAIGVMPLEDREYERGKCAFKLVQYFSAGLPVVASPVGMNVEVVVSGVNGFLASTDSDWFDALDRLLGDAQARRVMGANGYETFRARFTLDRNAEAWLDLFRRVAA